MRAARSLRAALWRAPGHIRLAPAPVAATLVAAAALACAPGAEAHAPVLVTPADGALGAPYQGWVHTAQVPAVPGQLRVYLSGCPGKPRAAGCVYYERLDRIYLRRTAPYLRGAFHHELGHLFDFRVLNDRDRDRFKRLLGQPDRRWAWSGANPPAERFAEAYSWCARYRRIRSIGRFATYGYDPSPGQHVAMCDLIRKVAAPGAPPKPPPNPPAVTRPHPPPPAVPTGKGAPDDGQPPEEDPVVPGLLPALPALP